jgi:hypothetical protein
MIIQFFYFDIYPVGSGLLYGYSRLKFQFAWAWVDNANKKQEPDPVIPENSTRRIKGLIAGLFGL